ncbi:MAG: nucleoside-diphosphate sugar epimerase/dehydratase [Alphaproteobacteria bacterium]|nr:nucleoside-diphosphate sugar epimerase/dehydratase [Alphaproteobacteria bacterium]
MKRHFNIRSLIAALHDALMASLSFIAALYLRLGDDQLSFSADYFLPATLLLTAICIAVFTSMHLYRGLWRFASMRDMVAIAKSVSLAMVIFAACMFLFNRLEHLPRSVLFINWLLLMFMLAAPRFAYRSLKDRTLLWEMTLEEKAKIPVLVIGATGLAEQFIQDMSRDPRTGYRVVGILDNDAQRHHRTLHRTRIYGSVAMLPEVLKSLTRKGRRPHKILIADPHLSGDEIKRLMEMADEEALPVARIPRLSDFKQHFDEKLDVQPIALEDLLGRPQMPLDRASMRSLIAGKRVLVTGAGGSIGSELVRQLVSYRPEKLLLLDACEYNLYEIKRAADALGDAKKITGLLGDVRDEQLIAHLFLEHKPEIVFHAAAIKHVPLAEENPEEAILTNIFGTKLVADACARHAVADMVMISTDKAVNPTNVMGATKKLAESYCQALARNHPATRFSTVRFGNVLGSTGSVVPLFAEQIVGGGPVTVTHPDMTRYFMTIREAVELVLQAAAIGASMPGERGHIFVLDMGSPVKIADLATQMIKLAGHAPEDIAIIYTGLRPGEKLHEELFHDAETLEKTPHASIFLASSRTSVYSEISPALEKLKAASLARQRVQAVSLLKALVPEFNPLSNVA